MLLFLASLLRFLLNVFSSRQIILSKNALLWKENETLLRKVGKKRVRFSFYDRVFVVVLNRAADIKDRLTLVRPETVLAWQRTLIRRFWTFEHCPARSQIQRILEEYIAYYNTQRPHKGIQRQVPKPSEANRTCGPIRKSAVLSGLHHHYSRRAA